MWQKGPGEGFHAAKDDALALDPALKCRAVFYQNYAGARRQIVGYVVENAKGETVGKGTLSRDAWGEAVFKLNGNKHPFQKKRGL